MLSCTGQAATAQIDRHNRGASVCVRLWSLSYTCALIAHASNTKHTPGEEALIKAFALLPSFLPTEGRAETTLAVPV